MNKKIEIEYDNHIKNIDELIEQLKSLKQEALIMLPEDLVFQRDYHALKIIIRYLEELKNE